MADMAQLEIALRNADAAGDTPAAQALAGEIMRMRAKHAPAPVDVVKDMAKSAGTGLAEGAIGLAGAGDVRELASKGVDYLGGKVGASPETIDKVKSFGFNLARSNPLTAMIAVGPTSAELQKKVEAQTGEFYKPQTTAGEYARTVGQFVPAAAAPGPGGIIRRVATQAVLPGVASEAAGQYTKGTDAEPYARTGAALAAAVAGSKRIAPERVTAADLKAASTAAYESPEVKGLVLEPLAMQRLGSQVERAMEAKGARRDFAGPAFKRADELADLPNTAAGRSMKAAGLPVGATVDDVKSVRAALGEVVRGGTDPMTGALNPTANAAVTGRKKISEYLANVPAQDVRSGDAAAAGKLLTQADADYAASKRAGLVEVLMRNAELNTGAANSGQNINNQQRQQLKALAKNAKKNAGLNDAEMAQLERTVLGTKTGNAMRFVGNALAPSGAMALQNSAAAAALGGGAAYFADRDPAAAALAATVLSQVIGRGARAIGNASTARQVAKFEDMVVSRAPSHDAIASTKAANASRLTADERRRAIARALLMSQTTPRLQLQQN